MNKRGQKAVIGFALIIVAFLYIISSFGLIDSIKENLDVVRGSNSLNCRGTSTFNQTAYDLDESDTTQKLTRRPTCFVTGMGLVYFIGSFLIAVVVWLVVQWRKIK